MDVIKGELSGQMHSWLDSKSASKEQSEADYKFWHLFERKSKSSISLKALSQEYHLKTSGIFITVEQLIQQGSFES